MRIATSARSPAASHRERARSLRVQLVAVAGPRARSPTSSDAVAPAGKASARSAVSDWLTEGGEGCVGLNGVTTEWHDDDVRAWWV
jgi:citrate lyase beta subunit